MVIADGSDLKILLVMCSFAVLGYGKLEQS
jgi:hypothetical protein